MNKAILAGAVGGLALPTLRAALKYTHQGAGDLEVSASYFVGVALLALLGAFTVWVLEESKLKNGFIIGLSLPSTISALTAHAPAPAITNANEPVAFSLFVASAYAAETRPSIYVPPPPLLTAGLGRQFQIETATSNLTVQFVDAAGKDLVRVSAAPNRQYSVPDRAVKAVITSPHGGSDAVPLGAVAGSVTVARVNVEQKRRFSFAQSLGAPPTVQDTLTVSTQVKSARHTGAEVWLHANQLDAAGATTGNSTIKHFVAVAAAKDFSTAESVLLPGDSVKILARDHAPNGEEMLKVQLTALSPAR